MGRAHRAPTDSVLCPFHVPSYSRTLAESRWFCDAASRLSVIPEPLHMKAVDASMAQGENIDVSKGM